MLLIKRHWPVLFPISFFLFMCWFLSGIEVSDPDRLYHFAISKLTLENGLLRKVPSIVGLGWDSYFPEKELLFHVFTTIGYGLGEEAGVLWLVRAVSVGFLILLYVSINQFVSPIKAGLFCLLPLFIPDFLMRLLLMRPHLLAMVFFMLLVIALLRSSKWVAAFSGVLFALSYHGFYIPLVLLCLWAVSLKVSKRSDLKVCMYGLVGLAVGYLLNPYFPSPILMGIQTLKIALFQIPYQGLEFGPELTRLEFITFIYTFFIAIVLFLAVIFLLFGRWLREKVFSFHPVVLLGLVFSILLPLSSRIQEYSLALLVLALAFVISKTPRPQKPIFLIFLICGFYFSLTSFSEIKNIIKAHEELDVVSRQVVSKIPRNQQLSVYNCDWWDGHYLMYLRPQAKIVDVLDPSLLWMEDEQLFLVSYMLKRGRSQDPYAVLKDVFKADYVYCRGARELVQQLKEDSRLDLVTLGRATGRDLYLFRLKQ